MLFSYWCERTRFAKHKFVVWMQAATFRKLPRTHQAAKFRLAKADIGSSMTSAKVRLMCAVAENDNETFVPVMCVAL